MKRLRRMRFRAIVIEARLFVNNWDLGAAVMPHPAASNITVNELLTLTKNLVQR